MRCPGRLAYPHIARIATLNFITFSDRRICGRIRMVFVFLAFIADIILLVMRKTCNY